MSDIVENNPKKELMYALGGIALFLGIVLLIGISAFLRPAGEHITAETTEVSAADTDTAEVIEAEDTATTEATDVANADDSATPAVDTAADATTTPAPATGDAIVAAEAGTATTSGTVNQAAVTDATTEQADADLASTTEDVATAE